MDCQIQNPLSDDLAEFRRTTCPPLIGETFDPVLLESLPPFVDSEVMGIQSLREHGVFWRILVWPSISYGPLKVMRTFRT